MFYPINYTFHSIISPDSVHKMEVRAERNIIVIFQHNIKYEYFPFGRTKFE